MSRGRRGGHKGARKRGKRRPPGTEPIVCKTCEHPQHSDGTCRVKVATIAKPKVPGDPVPGYRPHSCGCPPYAKDSNDG